MNCCKYLQRNNYKLSAAANVRKLWLKIPTHHVHKTTTPHRHASSASAAWRRPQAATRRESVSSVLQSFQSFKARVYKVTYYDETSGSIIMRVIPEVPTSNGRDTSSDGTICVLGNLGFSPMLNETIAVNGQWTRDKRYGDQFKAKSIALVNTNAPGHGDNAMAPHQLVTYLTDTISNIGPKRAAAIVAHFGDETMSVLDNECWRLREVRGLPKKLVPKIEADWTAKRKTRDIHMFLHKYGITGFLANALVIEYGITLPAVLAENPYKVTRIRGISFARADKIARAFGAAVDGRERLKAAIWHVLSQSSTSDVYLPQPVLLRDAARLLRIQEYKPKAKELLPPLKQLVVENQIIEAVLEDQPLMTMSAAAAAASTTPAVSLPPVPAPQLGAVKTETDFEWNDLVDESEDVEEVKDVKAVAEAGANSLLTTNDPLRPSYVYYLPLLYRMEGQVAETVAAMVRYSTKLSPQQETNALQYMQQIQSASAIQLSVDQQTAVRMALHRGVSVMTGGPGCGKTMTISTIVKIWEQLGLKCLLLAPTGRAASRLSELTSHPASTIHRALKPIGYNDMKGTGFKYNEYNKLPYTGIIVDECSMVDLPLMCALMTALQTRNVSLLFVGDVDQLPSLGCGDVLRDLIDCGLLPVSRLNTPFRQKEHSTIISNAARIRNAKVPLLEFISAYKFTKPQSDCLFINYDNLSHWPRSAVTTQFSPSLLPTATNGIVNAINAGTELMLTWLVQQYLPSLGFNAYTDLQVLSPVKNGATGDT